jgi:hypothetical protein
MHVACQILPVRRPQGSASAELCCLGHADTSVPLDALKVVAYVESNLLADALAKRLGDH